MGLSARALAELAELERRTVAADGGRLKLEWAATAGALGERVDDVLWWDGERLVPSIALRVGFPAVELAGIGRPRPSPTRHRSACLRCLRLCAERAAQRSLLVVPRGSTGGHALARRGAGSSTTRSTPSSWMRTRRRPTDPSVTLRPRPGPMRE
jgi:hypothetical protein